MKNTTVDGKYKSTFATQLREALKLRGMSQANLAKEAKMSEQTISYYANGERQPNTDVLIKLSKALNVSADYLLGLQDIKSNDLTIIDIHNKLGLSEETIAKLSEQMQYLYDLTGLKTPKEAFEKINFIQRKLVSRLAYHPFEDIAKAQNLNLDNSDIDARVEAQTFVPFSYIFNKFATDESRSAILGELYDLIMFIESDYTNFAPLQYEDFDDILAIHIVRLQRAFMAWTDSELGRK